MMTIMMLSMVCVTLSLRKWESYCQVLLFIFLVVTVQPTLNEVTGHLKRLGSHRMPKGVTMIGKFSRPSTFFSQFVEPGEPLLMRGALEVSKHPGLSAWTDGYLREKFGDVMVNVETSKKENRKGRQSSLSLRQFLKLYLTEDIYMVHSLKDRMSELVLVPESVQCGGFQKVLQEAVLWMGSGETASVLHYDGLDNLLCLLDGHKDVVLIDKALKPLIEAVGFHKDGGYSDIDVNKVDLEEYSHLQNIDWYSASVLKGDCVFIPKGWYHHVRSSGVRHLAVNLWLSHLWWFNNTDCPDTPSFKPLKPIEEFGYASPNEYYRERLLELLHDYDFSDRRALISAISSASKERAAQFLDAIDEHKDTLITVRELYNFDIDLAVLKFPDVFGLPHNPVPGEEKERIILYPVKSEADSYEQGRNKEIEKKTRKVLKEDKPSEPETKNLQGSRSRITLSDDLSESDVEGEKDFHERERPSGLNIEDLDGPDSLLDEDGPVELLPDDQVDGVQETRDSEEEERLSKLSSDRDMESGRSSQDSQRDSTKVKEEL